MQIRDPLLCTMRMLTGPNRYVTRYHVQCGYGYLCRYGWYTDRWYTDARYTDTNADADTYVDTDGYGCMVYVHLCRYVTRYCVHIRMDTDTYADTDGYGYLCKYGWIRMYGIRIPMRYTDTNADADTYADTDGYECMVYGYLCRYVTRYFVQCACSC